MKTYNINDKKFINSQMYKDFIKNNPSYGFLKIRASAANQAIPIKGLKVVVSTMMGDDKVVFVEDYTNESGVVTPMALPVPKADPNNLNAPNQIVYEISATYEPDNTTRLYRVNMYENIVVVQNINIVPKMNRRQGDF